MHMKKALVLIIGALVGMWVLTGCSTVTGSGILKTEEREVSEFTQVEVSGSLDVIFKPAEVEGLTIEADDNILPLLEASVDSGILHLKIRDFTSINNATIHVTVFYRTLDAVVLNGPSSGTALEISQQKLSATLSGPANLTLGGVVDALTLNLSGPSSVKGFALTTQNTSANLSGATNAQITVEKTLTASLSGASTLTYQGDPSITETHSGPSTLQKAQ
jgi:hypothetical protein